MALLDADALCYYHDRPVEFISDQIIWPARKYIHGLEMTADQKSMANAIAQYNRVSCESGHGSGKSTAKAWIGMWYTTTRRNTLGHLVKVPCLAPTYHQLYDILWPEFKRWIPMSRLASMYHTGADEIYVKGQKTSNHIRARSPKKPDNVQGFHATHLLWIVDEAFGITDPLVWETIEGSLTEEDNRILIAGQHTTIIGYVHDTFNRDKEFWKNLRFSSETSPLVKKEYCYRIARRYGKSSDIYRVRVLGMAPKGNPDAFISLAAVEAARHREVEESGRLEMGVDCARFGDDLTVVTTRIGNHVYPQAHLDRSDTDQTVELIKQELRKYRLRTMSRHRVDIKIDATGGYGAGVVDALQRNRDDNIRVVPVTFGAAGTEDYHDNITTMWAELRDAMPYIQLPNDEDSDYLAEELSSRKFGVDSKGRDRILPKSDYKKEYGQSPDRADSLVLAFTSKTEVERVWPTYISTDVDMRYGADIAWDRVKPANVMVFVTIIREPDNSLHCGHYYWSKRRRELRIYAESVHPTPTPHELAHTIRTHAQVSLSPQQSSPYVGMIIGNHTLFSGMQDMVRQMRKTGVRPKRNPKHNDAGGVMLTQKLFAEKRIKVHYSCEEHDRQLREWYIQNRKPVPGYPLAIGLCHVVTQLQDMQELFGPEAVKPYSPEKTKLRERLRSEKTGKNTGITAANAGLVDTEI